MDYMFHTQENGTSACHSVMTPWKPLARAELRESLGNSEINMLETMASWIPSATMSNESAWWTPGRDLAVHLRVAIAGSVRSDPGSTGTLEGKTSVDINHHYPSMNHCQT